MCALTWLNIQVISLLNRAAIRVCRGLKGVFCSSAQKIRTRACNTSDVTSDPEPRFLTLVTWAKFAFKKKWRGVINQSSWRVLLASQPRKDLFFLLPLNHRYRRSLEHKGVEMTRFVERWICLLLQDCQKAETVVPWLMSPLREIKVVRYRFKAGVYSSFRFLLYIKLLYCEWQLSSLEEADFLRETISAAV